MAMIKRVIKDNNGNVIETITVDDTAPDFVPQSVSEIRQDYMIAYCQKQGKDAVQWLIDEYNGTETIKRRTKGSDSKEEKTVNKTFMTIRKEFCEKFFPHLIKGEKVNSRKETIARLRKMLDSAE